MCFWIEMQNPTPTPPKSTVAVVDLSKDIDIFLISYLLIPRYWY